MCPFIYSLKKYLFTMYKALCEAHGGDHDRHRTDP